MVVIFCHRLGFGASAGGYSNGGGAKANKPGKEPGKLAKLHVLCEIHEYLSICPILLSQQTI